jgi:hypothetical protein
MRNAHISRSSLRLSFNPLRLGSDYKLMLLISQMTLVTGWGEAECLRRSP